MEYELISEEEYASLPMEDNECFVAFESICRRNMTRMINSDTSQDFDRAVRQQYMAAVAAVATECSIPNIEYKVSIDGNFYDEFSDFSLAVQGEVARIRIRQRGDRNPYSVLLTHSTRSKIDHYISRIRDAVDKSEMDLDRKGRVFDKLDQLSSELSAQRLSFAKAMAILVGVTTITTGVVTIAADGESAITQIMRLIGIDKATEEAATKRLSPPPKALPAPVAKKPAANHSAPPRRPARFDVDDDIPF